jgi:hypothetical protein
MRAWLRTVAATWSAGAIALAWLFHLVGDIHQSLHTAQLFTAEYPRGDRGGNEICVRVTQAGQPMDLHKFWDRSDYLKPKPHPASKRGHGAPKPPRVGGVSSPNLRIATLTRGLKRASRLRRRSLTVMGDGLGFRGVAAWTARWSQRLPRFLRDTWLVRGGLLTEG